MCFFGPWNCPCHSVYDLSTNCKKYKVKFFLLFFLFLYFVMLLIITTMLIHLIHRKSVSLRLQQGLRLGVRNYSTVLSRFHLRCHFIISLYFQMQSAVSFHRESLIALHLTSGVVYNSLNLFVGWRQMDSNSYDPITKFSLC